MDEILVGALASVATAAVGALIWVVKSKNGRGGDVGQSELASILRPLPGVLSDLRDIARDQAIYSRQRDAKINEIRTDVANAKAGIDELRERGCAAVGGREGQRT